jgi:hypothetical protein
MLLQGYALQGRVSETPRPLTPPEDLQNLVLVPWERKGQRGEGRSQTGFQVCLEYADTRSHRRQWDLA